MNLKTEERFQNINFFLGYKRKYNFLKSLCSKLSSSLFLALLWENSAVSF